MAQEPPVPSDLKELLHKFVVAVIRDGITNDGLAAYGVKFFEEQKAVKKAPSKLQIRQSLKGSWWNSTSRTDTDQPSPRKQSKTADRSRRFSVSAEVYDPSKASTEPTPVIPKTKKEIEIVTRVAKEVLLLRSLDEDDFRKVVDALYRVKVKEGEKVITQGDQDAREFYIIETGKYDIYLNDSSGKDIKIGEYTNQGSFGELALMYNQPRAATITATTTGLLWALDRKTFQKLILGSAYLKREKYLKLLKRVEFLTELKNYELSNVCDALVAKNFKTKDRILAEGDAADGMYIIESGEVLVTKTVNLKEKELGKLGAGAYFGELALITKRPRAATVTATMDTKLAFLDVRAFERLLGPCMNYLKRNTAKYEKQLKDIFGADYKP